MNQINDKQFGEDSRPKNYLLDQIGGPPTLEVTVEIFYDRLLEDKKLTKFFAGVDMDRLKKRQRKFLTLLLTEVPKGIDVTEIISTKHDRLFAMGLNQTHFDLVVDHLVFTLQALLVKQEAIDEVVAAIAPLRPMFEAGAAKAASAAE